MLDAALNDSSNQYRGSSLWVRAHYTIAVGNIGDAKASRSVEVLDRWG